MGHENCSCGRGARPVRGDGLCARLKARISDEEAAAAGKRALVEAVLSVPMWPSKQAADAAERVLQGLAMAFASHADFEARSGD
jgi:hypothetical protein